MKAHECLLKSSGLLDALRTLKSDSISSCLNRECESGDQQCFLQLGRQAPDLEVTLNLCVRNPDTDSHQTQNDLEGVVFVLSRLVLILDVQLFDALIGYLVIG